MGETRFFKESVHQIQSGCELNNQGPTQLMDVCILVHGCVHVCVCNKSGTLQKSFGLFF